MNAASHYTINTEFHTPFEWFMQIVMNMYKYDVINVDAGGEKTWRNTMDVEEDSRGEINGEEANVTSLIHWC